jgi:hypothetical protein
MNSGWGGNADNTLGLDGVLWGYNASAYVGRTGGTGGAAASTACAAPHIWKNTHGANGAGGRGVISGQGYSGSAGGNNRNATRSGGAVGGNGGPPYDYTAGSGGLAGMIDIYQVF